MSQIVTVCHKNGAVFFMTLHFYWSQKIFRVHWQVVVYFSNK